VEFHDIEWTGREKEFKVGANAAPALAGRCKWNRLKHVYTAHCCSAFIEKLTYLHMLNCFLNFDFRFNLCRYVSVSGVNKAVAHKAKTSSATASGAQIRKSSIASYVVRLMTVALSVLLPDEAVGSGGCCKVYGHVKE
jgi:hypothetical protein